MKTAFTCLVVVVWGAFLGHISYRAGVSEGRLSIACKLFNGEPAETRAAYPNLSKSCAKYAPTPETYGERG